MSLYRCLICPWEGRQFTLTTEGAMGVVQARCPDCNNSIQIVPKEPERRVVDQIVSYPDDRYPSCSWLCIRYTSGKPDKFRMRGDTARGLVRALTLAVKQGKVGEPHVGTMDRTPPCHCKCYEDCHCVC